MAGSRAEQVVVVGGGVSGLAAARVLARAGAQVHLLEGSDHLGGWIDTLDAGGLTGRPTQPVDLGPDSLLVRAEAVRTFLDELGLTPRRLAPSGAGAYIWGPRGLRRLPRSSVFGVPDSPWALVRSGLVGPAGTVRAAADLVLPRTRLGADPSIADLLRPRLGREVFATLVEPMLGGVHAGRAELLSARSAVPEVAALARRHRSLLRAVRGLGPRTGGGSALTGFAGGMRTLVDALTADVRAAGGTVRTGTPVVELIPAGVDNHSAGTVPTDHGPSAPARPGGFRVRTAGGGDLVADRVVLAVQAPAAARLLRPFAPEAADAAAAIRYASVATVGLVYPAERLTGSAALPPGTGFLVPPAAGRLLVGCTWLTAKWQQPADAGCVVVRGMVGRDGDDRWSHLDDGALAAAVQDELAQALGRAPGAFDDPLAVVVRRMPQALPQYTIGHAERVAAVQAVERDHPGLHLTGAAYRGLGLAACLVEGTRVGEAAAAG